MRLRRIEVIAVALTLAFACFMGGYFAGSRGSVNVIAVAPQYGEIQEFSSGQSPGSGNSAELPPDAADASEPPDSSHSSRPPVSDASGGSVQAGGSEAIGAPRGGDRRININSASQSELMDLPGIGNVLAGRIVDYRKQNGEFSGIEDLKNVSGIGEKRFDAIKDMITVG